MRIELGGFPDQLVKDLAFLAVTQKRNLGPVFWQELQDATTAELSRRLRASMGEETQPVGFEIPSDLNAESTNRIADVLQFVARESWPEPETTPTTPKNEKIRAAAVLCGLMATELICSLDARLRAAKQLAN